MKDENNYNQIKWRDVNDSDSVKLKSVKSGNMIRDFILIGVIAFILYCVSQLIKGWINNSWIIVGVVLIIGICIVAFIIRRIHLRPKYKVADVIVDKIVYVESSEMPVKYIAVVSQGETTLRNINIYSETKPEVGSEVLLFMVNNDTWSVGII